MDTIKYSLPKKLYIDVSSSCNHKCSFCSNNDPRTIKKIMKVDEFEKILNNILSETTIKQLGLYGKGEPLLNKNIVKIINYASSKKIPYIFITTNGSLLNKSLLMDMLKSGLNSIKLSINAIDQKDYYNIHKSDCFNLVIENFKHIIQLKKTTYQNLKVLVSVINSKLSKDDVIQFYKDLLKNDFSLIDFILVDSPAYSPKDNLNESMKNINLKNICPRPFDEINVTSSGELNLCCVDFFEKFNFGSLKTNSLSKIWHNSKFNAIRKMHEQGIFPKEHLCYQCLITRQEMLEGFQSINESLNLNEQ